MIIYIGSNVDYSKRGHLNWPVALIYESVGIRHIIGGSRKNTEWNI